MVGVAGGRLVLYGVPYGRCMCLSCLCLLACEQCEVYTSTCPLLNCTVQESNSQVAKACSQSALLYNLSSAPALVSSLFLSSLYLSTAWSLGSPSPASASSATSSSRLVCQPAHRHKHVLGPSQKQDTGTPMAHRILQCRMYRSCLSAVQNSPPSIVVAHSCLRDSDSCRSSCGSGAAGSPPSCKGSDLITAVTWRCCPPSICMKTCSPSNRSIRGRLSVLPAVDAVLRVRPRTYAQLMWVGPCTTLRAWKTSPEHT